MQKLLLLLVGLIGLTASAGVQHLLPRPQQWALIDQHPFALQRAVALTDPTATPLLRQFLLDHGCTLSPTATARLTVSIDPALSTFDYRLEGFPNEGHRIRILPDAIDIVAASPTGVIRAAQTLAQLALGNSAAPALEAIDIVDFPAFKVRGYMHDVGRSFIEFETLKRQIDLLSRFKINVFHWHLTENQAWRFEIKAFPRLTDPTTMTRFPGKFYTQAQATQLEAYAAERGVTIIPEIDMPGHSAAFVRAMGYDMQTAQGVAALKTILDEVASAFPRAPYLHIGADEKQITYPRFLETMIDHVHSLGRKVVVWNPIQGTNVGTLKADMTQLWSTAGKAVAGIPNIDCRYNYTNHFDVFADLVGIYKSNIYYAQRGNPDIAGTISAPWNDRKLATETDILRQNNFYANLLASAERGWIGGGKQYIETGGTTLPNAGTEYDEFRSWEERFLYHKRTTLAAESIPYVRQTNVRWRITEAFPNGGSAALRLPPETEGPKDTYIYKGNTYRTTYATGAGIYLRHTWGSIIPAHFPAPAERTTAYAWTYVYSPVARTAGAIIEFYNYGRSEKDLAPNRGAWDRYGSTIALNDQLIPPPTYANTGKSSITNEDLLRDENFTGRAPLAVELKQGWNKIFIKLPYNPDGKQRLKKWLFTFVLTDPEGKEALDDLVYSPSQNLDTHAEQLAATLDDARRLVATLCGEEPGEYPLLAAADLQQVIARLEPTLSQHLPAAERIRQVQELTGAIDHFRATYATHPLNLPKTSAGTEVYGYHLASPLRGGYRLASLGAGREVVGRTAVSDKSVWTFLARTDGTFDIRNYADRSYISPASPDNSALRTVAAPPAQGWTLSPAATPGLFIVTSGAVQFNQTQPSLGQRLYNWGGGNNTTDTGCQFLIRSVVPLPAPPVEVHPLAADARPDACFDLSGKRVSPADASLYLTADGKKHLRR